jgi:hypothetical protein
MKDSGQRQEPRAIRTLAAPGERIDPEIETGCSRRRFPKGRLRKKTRPAGVDGERPDTHDASAPERLRTIGPPTETAGSRARRLHPRARPTPALSA